MNDTKIIILDYFITIITIRTFKENFNYNKIKYETGTREFII